MTLINLSTLMDALGGPVPVDAVLTFTATRSRASGAVVVANGTVTVRIVAGVPTETVDLVPSGVDWAYKATLSVSSIGRRIDRTVAVPDVPSVEWADLVDVDPATLLPDAGAVPAWTAAVGQVAGLLADTVVARDAATTAQGLSEDARDAAVLARGIAEGARDGAVVAKGASEAARDQAQTFAANTVELQDTTFTALIADEDSATRMQLSATMGAYLDVNVPVEVSGALASDPVVQAGVEDAIDAALPPAIAATLPGAVATEVTTQVTPHVNAAAGSASAAQTARAGSEAARDLALAGQFRGTALGTADLNTIITPGVYYQGGGSLATLERNYPAVGRVGLLEVFWPSSNPGTAITQKYTITWDSANARGIYQRVKFSAGETWQPWRFIPTQRVDQTAGRAIYTWDDVNNREQLIYVDTGWRNVTAELKPGWAADAYVLIRRLGSSVELRMFGLYSTGTGTTSLLNLLPGFRPTLLNPSAELAGGRISARTFEGDVIRSRSFEKIGDQYYGFSLFWDTTNPWPTTLPGIASGGIPNA